MELILYVIFVFTLLLIIFSINEYYENCKIKTCNPGYQLLTNADSTTSCSSCSVPNAVTYNPNTCTPLTCSGLFSPSGDACVACSVLNAVTYESDGTCKVKTCKPGYTTDGKTCTKCTNTTNVFTYNDPADNLCGIKQCQPGYTVTGTGISQSCNTTCSNSAGVLQLKNDAGYIGGYDQPSATEKTNVP